MRANIFSAVGRDRKFWFLFSFPCFLFLCIQAAVPDDNSVTPSFTLHLADGSNVTVKVAQIAENRPIHLEGEKPKQAAGTEIVSLRRDKNPAVSRGIPEQIFLANGDRLTAVVRELSGVRLKIQGDFGKPGEWSLPLSTISMIWMTTPEGVEHPNQFRRYLLAEKRPRDKLYLRNGEVIEGVVNSISGPNLQIESAKKEVAVPLARIALIAFNSELVQRLQLKGIHGRVLLDNGMRLTLASASSDGHELTGKSFYGGEVLIPMNRIVALYWLGGCVQYLSDLKPRSYEFRSYLEGFDWPYVEDASVMEGDLRLGGQMYDKGLGVHTACRLTYTLDSNVRAFEATVGMDDICGKEGSARVQVLIDGKLQELAWDGHLTGGGKPRNIRVNTLGAKEITLVTGFGELGDVEGCVDWADARLIKIQK